MPNPGIRPDFCHSESRLLGTDSLSWAADLDTTDRLVGFEPMHVGTLSCDNCERFGIFALFQVLIAGNFGINYFEHIFRH